MKIGLLGMGTVGGGVYELASEMECLQVVKALCRHPSASFMTSDMARISDDCSIETVVEAIGGLEPAFEYAKKALESGKNLVTANKLLVSVHGPELDALARERGVGFLFGAACGGGIPFLQNLRNTRRVDRIDSVGGILNGTTNFMLDMMHSKDMDYFEALSLAQSLGYAEREPASDVLGLDSARKLVLAVMVGMGKMIDADDIPSFGIASIRREDIAFARRMGREFRLCAKASCRNGFIEASVLPELVLPSNRECAVRGNLNLAWLRGERCGTLWLSGQGAGRLPTASNVLRDVVSLEEGNLHMLDEKLGRAAVDVSETIERFYLRVGKDERLDGVRVEKDFCEGDFRFVETAPSSLKMMMDRFGNRSDLMIARIREDDR